MAEIILPPEEDAPQTPELNIDKPTENSKVITIEFEAKKTNKVSTKDTNQQLYTTDTDAWFEFKETSLEGANGTYSVVFRNRHDGSIFQRTGDVVGGVAYYKIPHQEIRHAGAWRGQIVYTLSNGDTTSREFGYDVKGHILDSKDVREIVVEDFETLMSQLRSMKDNAELELANLVNTANQNETNRQAFFVDLVEDIDELQANYQELLDTGVLQTNINTKLEALEEEYAPKLTEVTAQLAQTMNKTAVTLSHQFADNTERDTYFTTNPVELVELTFVKVGTGYQQYINGVWEDSSPVLPEAVNQINDANAVADKTYSSNKIEFLLNDIGGGTSIDDVAISEDSTWSSSKIDSTKANKAQEDWITPTLLNGWTAGGSGVKYKKDEFGVVRLDFSAVPGTGVIFTLPVGYRPDKTCDFPSQSGGNYGNVRISRNGEVHRSVGTGNFLLAFGITFVAEG